LSGSIHDIFISYAREDEAWVSSLAAEFERQGHSVFWDRHIPPGQTWRSYIGKALKQARCVVVVWSVHSVDSEWVIEEAEQAKRRGVFVPVFKEDVETPIGFGQIQAADLSRWRPGQSSNQLQILSTAVRKLLDCSPAGASAGQGLDGPVSGKDHFSPKHVVPSRVPYQHKLKLLVLTATGIMIMLALYVFNPLVNAHVRNILGLRYPEDGLAFVVKRGSHIISDEDLSGKKYAFTGPMLYLTRRRVL
jgi:TIR domain